MLAVCVCSELMPKLPQTGVFAINSILYKTSSRKRDAITWQWQDDGIWRMYSSTDSRAIEVVLIVYCGAYICSGRARSIVKTILYLSIGIHVA